MDTLKLFGPPGTGKTHRLLDILERELAAGVPPERIAFLTFTVAARREARTRAMARFGFTAQQLPYFRTLHAIAWRVLTPGASALVRDASDLDDFAASAGISFTPQRDFGSEERDNALAGGGEPGDKLLQFDHWRRHKQLSAADAITQWQDPLTRWDAERFCTAYAGWKESHARVDFTDLLEHGAAPLPVDVVIVDEAQDLSALQWRVLQCFARDAKRLYIAGDDDQAIFAWAGADPESFLAFPGTVEVIGQSFRLPRAVHALATRMIYRVKHRQPKAWKPRDVEGRVDVMDDETLVDFARPGSFLVLYRSHYLGKRIEAHLRTMGLPYAKAGHAAPGAEWGPAIVAWEQLRKGQEATAERIALVTSAMVPAFARNFMGETRPLMYKLPWFDALLRIPEEEMRYLRAVGRRGGTKAVLGTPAIRLSTIHAAKGAEADHVVLLTEMGRTPREVAQRFPDPERRVWYVGVTRARETLTLVGTGNELLA